jgi:hypothetical protein
MKDSNNSDKVRYTPLTGAVGRGKDLFERIMTKLIAATTPEYISLTHYQQLPINVILSHLQVQPLIEKGSQDHELHVPVLNFSKQSVSALAVIVYA